MCGEPLLPRAHPNTKYCPDCRLATKRKNNSKWTAPPEVIDCQECGNTFRPYRSGQKLCSQECRNAASKANSGPADPQMQQLYRNYIARGSLLLKEVPEGSRVVVSSDFQLPFIDIPVVDAYFRFLEEYQPHYIFLNGDILDCYELSTFDQNPNRTFSLQDEIMMGIELIERHKEIIPGAKIFWIDGNHEERINRTIWKASAQNNFSFLVQDLATVLNLDERVDGYVPYGAGIDFLGFLITHGNYVSTHSAYTARKHLDNFGSSGVNGHTHRLGAFFKTDLHPFAKTHAWYECGCMCRIDLEYVKGGKANWQQGFLIGEVWDSAFHPQLVPVVRTDTGSGFTAGGSYYRIERGA